MDDEGRKVALFEHRAIKDIEQHFCKILALNQAGEEHFKVFSQSRQLECVYG